LDDMKIKWFMRFKLVIPILQMSYKPLGFNIAR